MDLTQLANLGEFIGGIGSAVGAIAVIATLVYLAVQVRQNTMELRVASRLEIFNQQDRYTAMLIDNPEARRAWRTVTGDPWVHSLANPEGLNDGDLNMLATAGR